MRSYECIANRPIITRDPALSRGFIHILELISDGPSSRFRYDTAKSSPGISKNASSPCGPMAKGLLTAHMLTPSGLGNSLSITDK